MSASLSAHRTLSFRSISTSFQAHTGIVKAVLAALALAAAAWKFTWPVALVLLTSISVHELGHLWAMRRRGMKTHGFYLIPFLGGAAIADTEIALRDEPFIAIMGPVAGLLSAPLYYAVGYAATGSLNEAMDATIFAVVINLFNMLPILPLDGGRILRGIASSFGRWPVVTVVLGGCGLCDYMLWTSFSPILLVILITGLCIAYSEFTRCDRRDRLSKRRAGGWLAAYVGVYLLGLGVMIGSVAFTAHMTHAGFEMSASSTADGGYSFSIQLDK